MRRLLLVGLLGIVAVLAVRRWRAPGPRPRVPAALAFPLAGGSGLPLRAERVLTGIAFRRPLFLCAAPGDDASIFVVEQGGRILRVARRAETASVFLDLSSRVTRGDMEEGLLGLAFDPGYAGSRAFYVYYSATPPRRSVISRFRVPPGRTDADPATEEVLLEIPEPYGNHNGGMLAFGPDGFLYVGVGDGGSGGDPHGHGQDRSTLLGSILRIDPRGGIPYAIPADNPFPDGRREIWAYGLRNPWRFSFGPDGSLWAGDVGQERREEINRIVRGGNYGWNVFEGSERYGWRNTLARGEGMIGPVHEYEHRPAASVTGGYVYRGRALPAYRGKYFFGDFVTGQVWTLAEGEGGADVRQVAMVPSLSSFGEDADGELYALSLGGAVYRFREREEDAPPPARLSGTGLFADTAALLPARGLVPYEVRHPAWHDGASARRWIALPAEGRIGMGDDGEWTFPPGTALVMHLERDGRRRETRVLFRDHDAWAAYSYRWNGAQTDALRSGDRVETAEWTFPGTTDCFACHNEPAGRVLGVRPGQLGRELDRWKTLGLLDRGVATGERTDPLPSRDGGEPLERRVRAYLDVNCACCHREGGYSPSEMDLRYGIAPESMGILDAPPRQPPRGTLADRIVAPGHPEGSQLWQRLHAEGSERMPPGSRVTDPLGASLVREWIESAGR